MNMINKWPTTRISDISENLDSKRVPVARLKRKPGDIPYYGATGIVDYVDDYIFDEELLLIGEDGADWSGGANTAFIINGKSWVNNHAHVLRIKDANIQFVMNYLNYSDLRNYISGTTRGKLNQASLNKIKILNPSLKIQARVADILSTIDETIKKTDHIIQKAEKLKKGLVAEIVENNISGQKYKIKDISEVTSSKRVMVSDYVEAGIPFYRSTEIIKKSKNIPVTDTLYISIEKFNSFKERFGAPGKGDILITAVGTIGNVYLVQDETFYFKDGNSVWIRKLKDFVQPGYLKMIIASSYYRDKLNNISGGSSQKALTIKKLEDVEVPIPSNQEQKRIVEILSSIDNKIQLEQSFNVKLKQLKNGLMQDIFNQKVEIV